MHFLFPLLYPLSLFPPPPPPSLSLFPPSITLYLCCCSCCSFHCILQQQQQQQNVFLYFYVSCRLGLVWFWFLFYRSAYRTVCLLACLIGQLLYLALFDCFFVCSPDWLFSLFLMLVYFSSLGLSLFSHCGYRCSPRYCLLFIYMYQHAGVLTLSPPPLSLPSVCLSVSLPV